VERFQREIRTQAPLHHPHILPVFNSGLAAGHLYYVMPNVETGTLQDRLDREAPLAVGTHGGGDPGRPARGSAAAAHHRRGVGPFLQTYLAQIHLLTCELDKAVATLRPLLTFPSWITPAELTSDPLWAPLRPHPGFASLAAPTP
jgi:hypothetical protein